MVLPKTNPTKSYWIEAAGSHLRDFRSSEQLPEETDIVIIGSGYSGASAAYWIDKHTEHAPDKPRMVMLEARDLCGGATGRNGGQLRPHLYSRYLAWKERFGAHGAMELITHEHAHLQAFKDLAQEEAFAEEACLEFGETFDAAMTEEAWTRLKANYEAMKEDHGQNNGIFKTLQVIEEAQRAEDFSQMKGALAAIVHPSGQIWPYKFVHALLRIVLAKTDLNIQTHTPAVSISDRDSSGFITVQTHRGPIRTRTVLHATNRWASHLLPEFTKLILGERSTLAAIDAPEGFIKHTGAQHWNSTVNNYHLQLPPPYNAIILGGGRQYTVHRPHEGFPNDDEDQQYSDIAEFFATWPASDVKDWQGSDPAKLSLPVDQGGCWTGMETTSIDSFPFVGAVPGREGHFMAAGFAGHGMPRILLSTAHMVPEVLKSIDAEYKLPALVKNYPPLPAPFHVTLERVQRLQSADVAAKIEAHRMSCAESAKKLFCRTKRCKPVDITLLN